MSDKITGDVFGVGEDVPTGWIIKRVAAHDCYPPSLARNVLGRGTVWRCECGKRWIVNRYVCLESGVWMRRYLPWPR